MEGIDPKAEWDKFQLQTYRFNAAKHSEDNCQICQVAKWTPIGKKQINPNWKPKVASNGEKESTLSKKKIPKKNCFSCKQETGPGIPHHCTPNSAKKNIANLVAQQSTTGQEQILSESIKNLVKNKSGESGSQMRFTGLHGGNPISVTVG